MDNVYFKEAALMKFIDYIGKKLSSETLEKYGFYRYKNGICNEFLKKMRENNCKYSENAIKKELPKDCWVVRTYVPEGCCIESYALLAFELTDDNVVKSIRYMVEYVHIPGCEVPYMDINKKAGNFYGFQWMDNPYMIEEFFDKLMKEDN